jgi:hypothetical protein
MDTNHSEGPERSATAGAQLLGWDERRCFKSAKANCGPAMYAYDFGTAVIVTSVMDEDPAENGYHCCMLSLGHEGPCVCDECCREFTPDGVLRTIGEIQNASMARAEMDESERRATAARGADDLLDQSRAEFLRDAAQFGWTNAHSQALARWAKEHPFKSGDEEGFYASQRFNCRMAGFLHPSELKDLLSWKGRLEAVDRSLSQHPACPNTQNVERVPKDRSGGCVSAANES